MPTYTYKCPVCRRIETQTHSLHDSPVFFCVDDDVSMFRVLSAVPATFRGEGFYTNDKEW